MRAGKHLGLLALFLLAAAAVAQEPPRRIQVDEKTQRAKLRSHKPPTYPRLAELAQIEGVVRLRFVVTTDGLVKELEVLSGHPLLVGAAMESARTYRFERTIIDGAPVEVETLVRVAFFLNGHSADAKLKQLREAVKRKPNNAASHGALADFLQELGELDESLGEYQREIELDPTRSGPHFAVAEIKAEQGQIEAAISACLNGLKIYPRSIHGHMLMADYLQKKGDWAGVVAEYRQLQKIEPQEFVHYLNLAIRLKQKGDLDAAIVEMREAIRRGGPDSFICYPFGEILEAKGDVAAAFEQYKRAHRAEPRDEKVRLAYERLSAKLGRK